MLFRWMRSYANNQFNRYAIRNNNNSYVNSPYIFFYTWFYINTILCSCSSNRKLHWCKKKAEFLVYSGQYHSVYFYPFTHFPCSISLSLYLFLSLTHTRTHTHSYLSSTCMGCPRRACIAFASSFHFFASNFTSVSIFYMSDKYSNPKLEYFS